MNKFNMFEGLESTSQDDILDINDINDITNEDGTNSEDIQDEIISITMKTESKKKYSSLVVSRSKEEYETYIEGFYYETHYHPLTNEPYQVKVTVLKPEVNPFELLKPAYCYGTTN